MQSLIDIGANLTHDSFNHDISNVLQNAESAGICSIIVTGTSVAESERALELANKYPQLLYATAGIHPHYAKNLEEGSINALRKIAACNKIIAIGECGLDYYRNFSSKSDQITAFSMQLELAAEINLPVFLHQRKAHTDFVKLLKPMRHRLKGGGAHCFTGGLEQLYAYLQMDLYIGITGWLCDEKRGASLRKSVPQIPLERLLLETDAPYLMPKDLPNKPSSRRNEPKHLPHILKKLSEILNIPELKIAEASRVNAQQLFGLN